MKYPTYNRNWSHKHHAEWKNPSTAEYIMLADLWHLKSDSGYPEGKGEGIHRVSGLLVMFCFFNQGTYHVNMLPTL